MERTASSPTQATEKRSARSAEMSPAELKSLRTMRAAVIAAPGTVRVTSVPVPEPGPGEVLVRLEGCGVCGSNLPPWEGRPWFEYPLAPGELGHEGWGRIEKTGPNVSRLKAGDRVAALSYRAYAEYDVAPETAAVKLPPALDGKPFPGEALGCAMNVFNRCGVEAGQTVAVVGIGFLGAVLTALCAQAGARVLALSRRDFSLKIAKQMGAGETICMDEHQRVIERVNELTGNAGCDRVIEAVGHQWPLDVAGEITRERGRLIIAGFHQDGPRSVNMQLWNWRGLDVVNAHERDPQVYVSGMEAAVRSVADGRLDPSPLYTHFFQLEQLDNALNTMKRRPDGFLKALIKL